MAPGTVVKFEEMTVNTEAPARVVLRRSEASAGEGLSKHLILRVTLKDSSMYALDLNAAAYGHSVVMPWSDYKTTILQDITKTQDHGTAYCVSHM